MTTSLPTCANINCHNPATHEFTGATGLVPICATCLGILRRNAAAYSRKTVGND